MLSATVERAMEIAGRTISSQAIATSALIAVDLMALLLAGAVANFLHWLYLGAPQNELLRIWLVPMGNERLIVFGALVATAYTMFLYRGHYSRRHPFWDETGEVLRTLVTLAALDASVLYLLKLPFSRFWLLGTWVAALPLITTLRYAAKRTLMKRGIWQRPTIVVGTGENAREAVAALDSEPLMGLEIVAFADLHGHGPREHAHVDMGDRHIPVLELGNDPVKLLSRYKKPVVVIALEQEELAGNLHLMNELHRECQDLRIVPQVRGVPLYGATVHHFFRHELFFLTLRNNLSRPGLRMLKRGFDVLVSSLLLVLLSPLFLYFGWRIREDGGSVIFSHTRIGCGGKLFSCYKFRTMAPNAQAVLRQLLDSDARARAEWAKDFKLKNDPRVTPVGTFLRRTSLDELPQLWNVLRGDMSLVGPRPIIEKELERYGEDVAYYLEARPGITGLWQVSGRNDAGYDYRVYLDSWYVKNWSLWYDIVILLKTIRVVLAKEGAY